MIIQLKILISGRRRESKTLSQTGTWRKIYRYLKKIQVIYFNKLLPVGVRTAYTLYTSMVGFDNLLVYFTSSRYKYYKILKLK